MPLRQINEQPGPGQDRTSLRAEIERAKQLLLTVGDPSELTGQSLAVIRGAIPDRLLLVAAAQLSGRGIKELASELIAEIERRGGEGHKQPAQTTKQLPSRGEKLAEPFGPLGRVRPADRRSVHRAAERRRRELRRKKDVSLALPRAFVRVPALSDHDRLDEKVDYEDKFGRVRMSHSPSFTGKKLLLVLGLPVLYSKGQRVHHFSIGELERCITTREIGANTAEIPAGVSGGEAANRIKKELLRLQTLHLDLKTKNNTASYEFRGRVIESIEVDFGPDHGHIPLSQADSYAQQLIARGERDPRRCIGNRKAYVVTFTEEYTAALLDKPVICDQWTITLMRSSIDLNAYIYVTAESFDSDDPTSKSFYVPTVRNSREAKEARAGFRIFGIHDSDLTRANRLLIDSLARLQPLIPAWRHIWRAPHKTNNGEWIGIEYHYKAQKSAKGSSWFRCPVERRFRKVPSRRQLRNHCPLTPRKPKAETQFELDRAVLQLAQNDAPPTHRGDGAQNAIRAAQAALA